MKNNLPDTPQDLSRDFDYGPIDDEFLVINRCICGAEFKPWAHVLSIYEDAPTKCPECGRMFYFRASARIYEVKTVESEA